jgi:lipopolysaccharide/colanic/teichoic acid biosynthesis glycosyltransferase
VGWRGRIFRIYKFRSMVVNAEKRGAAVTAEHDPRITRIGRWLRKNKVDELPQLLNVFFGDMSIVGPRPEVPCYVSLWSEADRERILSVKPGITDYATLYYHDEQALLAKGDNPERIYLEEVMPHKLEMYRIYARDRNFLLDLKIILATLGKIFGFSFKWLFVP